MKSREVQTVEFNIDLRCLKNKLLGFGKKNPFGNSNGRN